MSYNFASLYRTETIEFPTFRVTIREIPNGEYEALQKDFFGDVALSSKKDNLERQLNQRRVSFPEFAARKNILAIQSWSLKDDESQDVAVCIEAWRALPMAITNEIEKAIERLNPEDSEEFSGESQGSSPE